MAATATVALLRRSARVLATPHAHPLLSPYNSRSARPRPQPLSQSYSSASQIPRYSTSHRTYSTTASSASRADQDYYQLLGVSRTATPTQIKKAYYALAKNHHPDKSGGDPEIFAQVNQAYEALSDPKKRSIYDRYGEEGVRASAMGADPGSASGFPGGGPMSGNVDDILREFTDMFSNQRPRRPKPDDPVPGSDKQTSTILTLKEAAAGVIKDIRTGALDTCTVCAGSGTTSTTKMDKCSQCGGEGRVQNSFGMFQSVIMECQGCSGTGTILRDPCGRCEGEGVVSSVKNVSVSFPPGCDTGMVLRVPDGGDTGIRRGPPGDLYVQVRVKDDPYFHRQGSDLHVVAPISIAQAALGGKVHVNTIDGEEHVMVRPGTQPDDSVTLEGRALRSVKSSKRGHQVIHFKVVIPQHVSGRQKELLTELLELDGGKIERQEECTPRTLLQRFQRFLKRSVPTRS